MFVINIKKFEIIYTSLSSIPFLLKLVAGAFCESLASVFFGDVELERNGENSGDVTSSSTGTES